MPQCDFWDSETGYMMPTAMYGYDDGYLTQSSNFGSYCSGESSGDGADSYRNPFVDAVSGALTSFSEPIFYNMDEIDDKSRILFDEKFTTDGWKQKYIMHWTPLDIMYWIIHAAQSHDIDYENIDMRSFRTTGDVLVNMSETDFVKCDPKYGKFLYQALEDLKSRDVPYPSYSTNLIQKPPSPKEVLQFSVPEIKREIKREIREVKLYTFNSDADSERSETPKKHIKRPHDRRKRDKPTGRLWEFIRDLLLDRKYCPSLICWENYEEGVFRFVRSDEVAKLWGMRKQNTNMTYEKLSRAMRYYYKSRVLQPVLGRRLVYKFGPTATGWRTPNPNFMEPVD